MTLSAVSPTAFRYAGTDPSTNKAEPMTNNQAIAALREAGFTVGMRLMLSVQRVDQAPRLRQGNFLDHVGEMITGRLRSKYSGSPTLSLFISSICACNSGGGSLRSPSRASASRRQDHRVPATFMTYGDASENIGTEGVPLVGVLIHQLFGSFRITAALHDLYEACLVGIP